MKSRSKFSLVSFERIAAPRGTASSWWAPCCWPSGWVSYSALYRAYRFASPAVVSGLALTPARMSEAA